MLDQGAFSIDPEEMIIGFECVAVPGEKTTVKITTPEGFVIVVSAMEFLRLLDEYGSIVRFRRKESQEVQ